MNTESNQQEEVKVKRLPESFGIRFGVINPSIAKQIKSQGLKYNPDDAKEFEMIREAIHTLTFSSMLVDTQIDRLFIKLYNKILRHVGKANGCNVHPIKIKK